MDHFKIYLFLFLIVSISFRLWGNLSVQVLTGINPIHLPVKKRILHWFLSMIFSLLSLKVIAVIFTFISKLKF